MYSREEERKPYKQAGLALVGFAAVALFVSLLGTGILSLIRNDRKSQFADPNKLEVIAEDLDGDGQKETLMNYDGKSYLLRLNEQGKPELHHYKVRPAAPSKIELID